MRKSIKKSIAVLTVSAIALGMTACGTGMNTAKTGTVKEGTSAKLDKEYIDMFKKAGKAVASTQGSAVKNVINLQGTSVEFLDVFTTDGSYTEYYVADTSALSEAEKGKVNSSEQETTDATDKDKEDDTAGTAGASQEGYVLSDWLTYTKDGKADKFYTVNTSYTGEKDSSEWYEFGKDMKDLAAERTSMYVDLLSTGISEVEDMGIQKGNTEATGSVDVRIFTAKLKGDVISKMLSLQGSMQYADALSTIKANGTKVDEAVLNELNNYNDYFTSLWTVGDGEIAWGIMDDDEGKLAFVDITTGGAGTTLTITKELILGGVDFREKPDFSSSEPYAEFIVRALKEDLKAQHDAHTQAEAEANGEVVEGETAQGTDTEEAPAQGATESGTEAPTDDTKDATAEGENAQGTDATAEGENATVESEEAQGTDANVDKEADVKGTDSGKADLAVEKDKVK